MTYLQIYRTKQGIVTIKIICLFQNRAEFPCIIFLWCTPSRQQVCTYLNLNVEKLNNEQINEIQIELQDSRYKQELEQSQLILTYYV